MPNIQREIRTIRHYFQTVFEAAGLKWDHDNDAEIEDALQGIADEVQRSSIEPAG